MTTQLEQLAAFVNRSSFGQLSENALEQLKIRVLDAAIGCSICALGVGAAEAGKLRGAARSQVWDC